MFGLLEKIGKFLASPFAENTANVSVKGFNFVKAATAPVVDTVKHTLLGFGDQIGGVLLILVGIGLIFLSITYVGKLLKTLMVGKAREIMHTAIGRGPLAGIGSGTLVTVLVQSSSTTTSLMVPLAGSGSFGLKQIYPFTLGANIGTCVTALLAATAVTGNSAAAMQIAFIHLTYNVLGVVVIYGLPFLRYLPVQAAEWLGETASENKLYALAYKIGVFFVVPALCLGITSLI